MKVFWAWQFDLPGKIARHFIREALAEAIGSINGEIEEPDEAFQMQLDYGRKGLKGSPDLAIEIMKKIEAASVFLADVTPVGKGPPYRTDDGKDSDGKPLMNPNVAIELGYALSSLKTDRVLMVMNNHYGKREDLPFDLGHKGGPIFYKLAPEASKDDITKEKKKLVGVLIEALSEYVPKLEREPFPALPAQIGDGIFFKGDEVLAEDWNSAEKLKYTMPARSVMWLRVIPTAALEMPLDRETLVRGVGRFGAFGAPRGMEPTRENSYGVCFFSPSGPNIDCISQYTRDGEIWGINADILAQGQVEHSVLMTLPMENLFVTSLDLYVEFMRYVAKVGSPLRVEAGIQGVKGRLIAHNSYSPQSPTMARDAVKHSGVLRTFEKAEQMALLLEFFKKVNAASGVPRPAGLYGRG